MNGPLSCNCGNGPLYLGSGVCSSIAVYHLAVTFLPYPRALSEEPQTEATTETCFIFKALGQQKSKMHAKLSKIKKKMIIQPLAHGNHGENSGKNFPLLAWDYPVFPPRFSSPFHINIRNYL
jgi:hypothetical protein